ncbi:MAG: acyl-CoA dehydrogenase family protein [Candidatus Tectomicrobia bacterium]|nr:acyl-CoA dehydrogenase family protein [Candidatus Tectomicrobia bacterium]
MDYDLPDELKLLQQTIRRVVSEHMIPLEPITPEDEDIPADLRAKLEQMAKDQGLWLLFIPAEYGGAGLSIFGQVIVWEEVSKTVLIPFRKDSIFGPEGCSILFLCNDQQKERYLYPVIRGERVPCFATSEPNAGSDPSAMTTTAVKDGSSYLLNGKKTWVTSGDKADFVQVVAVTDPAKRQRGGITAFLVDMDTPGLTITGKFELMMEDRPNEFTFENCRVPEANILGEIGQGFVISQTWITMGRLRQGAKALGVAQRCLDMAIEYAKHRVTFGKPIATRQAVQFMIADSEVELHAARLMVYHAAQKLDKGEDARHEVYIAKLYANEMVGRVVDRALQIHGAMGLSKELPLERWYRDVRSRRITEGPSEIMRWVIARKLLGRVSD